MGQLQGAYFHITGVVQGVGFRPFVYGLAQRLAITGWVRNSSAGVDIEAEGNVEALRLFAQALRGESPPLARIDQLEWTERPVNGYTSFQIQHSETIAGAFQPISPDMSSCPDCLAELFNPDDRRYRYPFINCTNCGPRFTIIEELPYDRPQTTMATFTMCPDCQREYSDPGDRRFHAQPIACPDCGPQVWLELPGPVGQPTQENNRAQQESGQRLAAGTAAIQLARQRLKAGQIVAIKGLGGFHLACDATSVKGVSELRRRKLRADKPFAVMMWDLDVVSRHCLLSRTEKSLLQSAERPIVIVARAQNSAIVPEVAPGQTTVGVMLPYTPLHYLLLEPAAGFPEALVMTSGNLSEEPIAYDNDQARGHLSALADAFLMHDRPIRSRCDDSVMRIVPTGVPGADGRTMPLRRSRGYAPYPVKLSWKSGPLLATGAEIKNSFCLTRENYAFLSHHIGDMENYQTLRSFEEGIAHLERLFRIRPEVIAYDLHPDYLATRYAQERARREGLPAFGIQHHHAHIAACLAEHGHSGLQPVIGVAFDGTGYGDDAAIWGGEFLLADYQGYRRLRHLAYVPLPGGDQAIREPWRQALAWLHQAGLAWDSDLPPMAGNLRTAVQIQSVDRQLKSGLNAPPTSSMGRLFDAVAALAGVRQQINYEAQAAMELEALVDPHELGSYPFDYQGEIIDAAPMIRAIVNDLRQGEPKNRIASRFHHGVSQMVLETCQQLRRQFGLSEVALSGGVWQNCTLLTDVLGRLKRDGFVVYWHQVVPANDGGLALGQAVIASFAWQNQ